MNARRQAASYLLAVLVPILLLSSSLLQAPYFFVADISSDLRRTASAITRLGRHEALVLNYTPNDLLYPQTFGRAGAYYEAVLFNVPPARETNASGGPALTWARQIRWALSMRDAKGEPLVGIPNTALDEAMADSFNTRLAQTRLSTAEISPFEVPSTATFHRLSGIRMLIAVAVTDVGAAPESDALRVFEDAIAKAFKYAANQGIRRVAVPYVRLGAPSERTDTWIGILKAADAQGRLSGITAVTFGGFAISEQGRLETDLSFRHAWERWSETLRGPAKVLVHEELRQTALVILGALGGAAYAKKALTIKRFAAILVLSATVALSISGLFKWLQPLALSPLDGWSGLLLRAALAAFGGIFIDLIVRFQAKDQL